jgi:glycosyltransferase involved in cell wall biosynthesis
MNISENFRFTGYVEKSTLIELYQSAAVYAFPSYYEGLPTSVLEAMACGTPVVATAIDGITEVVKDGQNGFTVPVKNPDAMANAIMKVLRDKDLQERIGRAARLTIEEGFTWEIVANRASECYAMLARSRESSGAPDHGATNA